MGEVQQHPQDSQIAGNTIGDSLDSYSDRLQPVGDPSSYVTPPSADPSIPGAPADQYVQVKYLFVLK